MYPPVMTLVTTLLDYLLSYQSSIVLGPEPGDEELSLFIDGCGWLMQDVYPELIPHGHHFRQGFRLQTNCLGACVKKYFPSLYLPAGFRQLLVTRPGLRTPF
jgi:hypothetical protein